MHSVRLELMKSYNEIPPFVFFFLHATSLDGDRFLYFNAVICRPVLKLRRRCTVIYEFVCLAVHVYCNLV